MVSGGSLLDKSVQSLEGPNILLSLSFDTRHSSKSRECTDKVDERRAVTQTVPKVSVRPTERSVTYPLSVHILPALIPRQKQTGHRA